MMKREIERVSPHYGEWVVKGKRLKEQGYVVVASVFGGASQKKSTTSTESSDDSVQFSQMQVRLMLQVSIDGLGCHILDGKYMDML